MKTAYSVFRIVLLFSGLSLFSNKLFSQKKSSSEIRIDELIKKMTIEEKVGQMAQITLDVLGLKEGADPFVLDNNKVQDAIVKYKLGSVLNTSNNKAMSPSAWNEVVKNLQNQTSNTKLKIPLIYGFDAIHGATYVDGATFFPQPLGQAATWNRELVHKAASITAYECKSTGVAWNFSPVLDLGVNPCWARLWETFGEDPYLTSQMGVQVIDGYQNPLADKKKILACLKHYLGYSDPKTGKDRSNAWMSENYLREYHLPSFRAGVKAGARTVMVNSALINGIPTHINKYLLTDVLKGELGFTGFVVTDWQDIDNVCRRDKIVPTNKEALMLAINAGIDMAMIPYEYKTFVNDLISLVKENKVPMTRIDDAVRRILRVKYELNLFSTPYTVTNEYPDFASAEFQQAGYDAAAESITLLKNKNNLLPISTKSKVLVTGPNANNMRCLNGGWSYSWQGEKTEMFASKYNTILEALQNKFGKENVSFVHGVAYKMNGKYFEDSVVDVNQISNAAAKVDYILLCLGENSYTEKPGDLNDLNLSDNQIALAEAAIKTGKPVLLVLNEGRPRNISRIEPYCSAIIDLFIPGNYGADALADILTGDINPSGKLPITYPKYVNALTNYIHKSSDEQSNPQGVYDYSADYNPLFDFGFGLSYTSFEYSDLVINKTELNANESISISVKVKNVGKQSGKEVVQVYVSDLFASLAPDVKRLRSFEKIDLASGEMKMVSFSIPVKDLAFINTENKSVVEKGKFLIKIKNLQKEINIKNTKIW
jgi:beta-glucosidase